MSGDERGDLCGRDALGVVGLDADRRRLDDVHTREELFVLLVLQRDVLNVDVGCRAAGTAGVGDGAVALPDRQVRGRDELHQRLDRLAPRRRVPLLADQRGDILLDARHPPLDGHLNREGADLLVGERPTDDLDALLVDRLLALVQTLQGDEDFAAVERLGVPLVQDGDRTLTVQLGHLLDRVLLFLALLERAQPVLAAALAATEAAPKHRQRQRPGSNVNSVSVPHFNQPLSNMFARLLAEKTREPRVQSSVRYLISGTSDGQGGGT